MIWIAAGAIVCVVAVLYILCAGATDSEGEPTVETIYDLEDE